MNLIKVNAKTTNEGNNMSYKTEGLKKFFADEFIRQDDKNGKLQLANKVEQMETNRPSISSKPVQRILNTELGESTEMMQPLMNIDSEIQPVNAKATIEMQTIKSTAKPRRMQCLGSKTIVSHRDGYVIKKCIQYETWSVIKPRDSPTETRGQGQRLEFPLVKLANALSHMTLPSDKWSSKVVLSKNPQATLKRHKLTTIPERDRIKYQPICVAFRRTANERIANDQEELNESNVSFDRIVICSNATIKICFEGKFVQLNGAPNGVANLQDMHKLLDIVHCISLSNPMIEVLEHQIYGAED